MAELVAALAGGKPDAPLLRLTNSAAGNSFYVTEIIGDVERSGGLTVSEEGTAQLADGFAPTSLPRSLTAAIADRLDLVPQPVREMLRMAALLGAQFAVPDLVTVTGKTVPGDRVAATQPTSAKATGSALRPSERS
jgi:predicted ATPase